MTFPTSVTILIPTPADGEEGDGSVFLKDLILASPPHKGEYIALFGGIRFVVTEVTNWPVTYIERAEQKKPKLSIIARLGDDEDEYGEEALEQARKKENGWLEHSIY